MSLIKNKFSKRAVLFTPLMILVMLFVLLFALQEISKKHNALGNEIGLKQAEILDSYQKGESILFYIDESAKIASQQTAYELAERGGFKSSTGCGPYFEHMFWYNQGKECYPDNIKKTFYDVSNKLFIKYLSDFSNSGTIKIPINGYDFLSFNNHFIGISPEKINIPVFAPLPNNGPLAAVGIYALRPNFNVLFKFDFDLYDRSIQKIKELVGLCSLETNPNGCAVKFVSDQGLSDWDVYNPYVIGYTGLTLDPKKIVLIKIKTGNKYLVEDNGVVEQKEMFIKFGIYFSDNKATGSAQQAVI